MARTDPGALADLADVLDDVRQWPAVVERSTGTFYCRNQPFMHFHVGKGGRRVDVRTGEGWVQQPLDPPASPAARDELRRLLQQEHARRVPTWSSPSRPSR